MASTLDDVDVHLRNVIHNLYTLLVQAHDHAGTTTQRLMNEEIKRLLKNLRELTNTARRLPTHLPYEIIEYVESSRNPDIYTREFVELVMRLNQQLKGRAEAFADFRDILGAEMMSAIPEIKDDVRGVLDATGGSQG